MAGKQKTRLLQSSPNSPPPKKPSSADGNNSDRNKPSRRTKSTILTKNIQSNNKKFNTDKTKLPTILNNNPPSNTNDEPMKNTSSTSNRSSSTLRLSFPKLLGLNQLIPVPKDAPIRTEPSERPINPESFNPENYPEIFWDGEVLCKTNGDGLLQQWQLYSERVTAQLDERKSSLKNLREARCRRRKKWSPPQQRCSKKNDVSPDPKDFDKAEKDKLQYLKKSIFEVNMLLDMPSSMYEDLL